MSLRIEFIHLASLEGANLAELCRQFAISRKTGYKWLKRYQAGGESALVDRPRRPHTSPRRSSEAVEAAVVEVRKQHPAWGGRKIKAYLENHAQQGLPSPSTITEILRRHKQMDAQEAAKHRPYQRFEREAPNQLWQMDFKGYFALPDGGYCYPLTVLDDHSRYLVGLRACPNQTAQTVQTALTQIFRTVGLPEGMLMDHGAPWGDDRDTPYTILGAWLLRLGIRVLHGRPYHPQTQGKDERLHRTLQAEVLNHHALLELSAWQAVFDAWRPVYNHERPHEALGMQVPASRYVPSPRPFPEVLPPIAYPATDLVRRVDQNGRISFHNRLFRVGRAFSLQPVGLHPAPADGIWEVYYCQQQVAHLNLLG